jgi:hypothetical protein
METKFKVGQVWRSAAGDLFTVTEIREYDCTYPVVAESDKFKGAQIFTLEGNYYCADDHDENDLVKLEFDVPHGSSEHDGAFDATRTEFIDRIVHDVFVMHSGGADNEERSERVRAAVKLRDELVKA